MNAKPNSEEIIAALRQSGYLMEQEVATQLEALDFHVDTNRAFRDLDEDKSREIDVRAIKRFAHNEKHNISLFIEILAECKNNSTPFVFIGRPKNAIDDRRSPIEYEFPVRKYHAKQYVGNSVRIHKVDAFSHLGFPSVHYDWILQTKAVQFCRLDRKGSDWHVNHSGLYDSLFYPIAKAVTFRKNEVFGSVSDANRRQFWFFVPMVVVSGDLLYVDSSKIDPAPEERDHITFRRELKSQNINGVFSVDFVRQDYIEKFVSKCLTPIAEYASNLVENKIDFVMQREIPWMD